jgi:hypothetical protein
LTDGKDTVYVAEGLFKTSITANAAQDPMQQILFEQAVVYQLEALNLAQTGMSIFEAHRRALEAEVAHTESKLNAKGKPAVTQKNRAELKIEGADGALKVGVSPLQALSGFPVTNAEQITMLGMIATMGEAELLFAEMIWMAELLVLQDGSRKVEVEALLEAVQARLAIVRKANKEAKKDQKPTKTTEELKQERTEAAQKAYDKYSTADGSTYELDTSDYLKNRRGISASAYTMLDKLGLAAKRVRKQ